MRLTLRTLLAYVDDALEAEDREDIAQKLRNNENATLLLERIRDVLRRARLGAPQVIGTGMGRDPNSVAEYLESQLAPEQILLIERVCLESDVHLAEVAAAHHIVAMVLREPAQVDPESRQRMYGLIDQPIPPQKLDEPVTAAGLAAAASAPQVPPPVPAFAPQGAASRAIVSAPDDADMASRKPEVPEYLRGSTGPSWKAIVVTLLAAVFVTAIALVAFNSDFRNRMMTALGLKKPPAVANGPEKPAEQPQNLKPAPPAPAVTDPKAGAPAVPVKPPTLVAMAGTSGVPAVAAVPVPAVPAPPVASTPPIGVAVAPAVVGTSPPPAVAVIPPPPVAPAAGGGTVGAGKPPVGVVLDPKIEVAKVDPAKQPPEPPPVAAAHAALGRVLSQKQILLRAKQAGDGWERLPNTAAVFAGDRLLVLPAFRPLISLSGISVQLDGPTEVQLGPTNAEGVPEIKVAFGRLIVRALGQANTRLRIQAGGTQGVLEFADAEATVGLEVHPTRPAGSDPEKAASGRTLTLFGAAGKTQWTSPSNTAALLPQKKMVLIDGVVSELGAGEGGVPAWVGAPQITPLDNRAVTRIEEVIVPERSVKLSLTELLLQRQVEVRNLAARSCAYIGLFDPLVTGLKDEDQRASWRDLVNELQAAVARDPQTAAAVRETLERLRREKAPELYRMLWGYSATGLKNGDARRLIELLDHEDLDFRVLSYMNLWSITGKHLNYSPEKSAAARKQAIGRWQKRLDAGDVVPVATPPNGHAPGRPAAKGAPPAVPVPAPPEVRPVEEGK